MKTNQRYKKGKFFAAVVLLAGLTLLPFGAVSVRAEQTSPEEETADTSFQDEADEKEEIKVSDEQDTIVSVLGDSISTYENYTSYKIHSNSFLFFLAFKVFKFFYNCFRPFC